MKGVFEKLYKGLNKEQRVAVDSIDGPVMVIAGPGTGKTSILTLRIANILRLTDTSASSILALTFTDSGVFSMKKKLVEVIGSEAHKVHIETFHSFANKIIAEHPDAFPRIIGSQHIGQIEQIKIMENIIGAKSLKYLKPYGDNFYYVKPALGMIRNLKREGISTIEFKVMLSKQVKEFTKIKDLKHKKGAHIGKVKGEYQKLEQYIKKNKELLSLYEEYEKVLKEDKLYDYEDMIMEAIRAFEENKNLLLEVQEEYQYVLADEHQDSNKGQNRLLELLVNFHNNPNLFIVGDEKQAIFRFQGASLENFLYFQKLYPKAFLIVLKNNYRSTQTILNLAGSLIKTDLKAKAGHKEEPVSLHSFTTSKEENIFLAKDIKKKKGEIAVLYRDNKDAFPIALELEKAGVPFVIESDQDILSDPEINKIILLLRAVADLGNEELKAQVLFIDFLGLPPLEVYKYFKENESTEVEEFIKKLVSWNSLGHNKNLVEFFDYLINNSGFMEHILSLPNWSELLLKVERFYDEIKSVSEGHRVYKLKDFIEYLDIVENYNVLIRLKGGENDGAIRLMTAHRSKGLEFDYVYITGLYDGHWGNKRQISHFHIPIPQLTSIGIDRNEDERRLFYVALTRARKHITLSYSNTGDEDRLRLPSQFLSELGLKAKSPFNKSKIDLLKGDRSTHYFKNNGFRDKKTPRKNKEYLNKLFREQGFSVTALNNYLKCPWKYFFNNLLRVPSLPNKHQMYGTAMHNALRDFFRPALTSEGKKGSKKNLLLLFERNLKGQFLDEEQFKESLEKGREALSGYYDKYKSSFFKKAITTELKIRGIELFPDVSLTGILDKIENIGDGKVNIVDYKTGKPKSRNYILGKTKGSNGDYKRQLIFYKILMDGYGKYKMETGEIDFVEPDYRKEKFEITSDEVEELKEIIKEISSEVIGLDFWDKTCKDKNCQFCALREVMRK